MFDRIEALLTLVLSLIASLSALIGVLEKLLRLWRETQDEQDTELAQQLEKDILHLQASLEQQGQQLEVLKVQLKKG